MLDSSALVAVLVRSDDVSFWVKAHISRSTLFAPELLLVETSNILRRLERAKMLDTTMVEAAFQDMRQLELSIVHFESLIDRAWELRQNTTIFDGLFVAAAEKLDAPLITLDEKLAKSSLAQCRFLTWESTH